MVRNAQSYHVSILKPSYFWGKSKWRCERKEAVVPNCVHNLPETRKIKPRLAETNSLQFGVVSGMHVQAKFCTWNANGAQPLQEHRAQENRIFQ